MLLQWIINKHLLRTWLYQRSSAMRYGITVFMIATCSALWYKFLIIPLQISAYNGQCAYLQQDNLQTTLHKQKTLVSSLEKKHTMLVAALKKTQQTHAATQQQFSYSFMQSLHEHGLSLVQFHPTMNASAITSCVSTIRGTYDQLFGWMQHSAAQSGVKLVQCTITDSGEQRITATLTMAILGIDEHEVV